jgi:hypothetical protein
MCGMLFKDVAEVLTSSRRLGSLVVHCADRSYGFLPLLIHRRSQPRADQMRLEVPFFKSRAACRGEICATMPRRLTSSAISRPVHWLIGRCFGCSQGSRDHLAGLFRRDLRRASWTGHIGQTLAHGHIFQRDHLPADPAHAPGAHLIHADSQVSGNLASILALSRRQDVSSSKRQLLGGPVPMYQHFSCVSLGIVQGQCFRFRATHC